MDLELSENLVAQYRQADYRVGCGPDAFVVHIDQYSEPMEKLLTAKSVTNAAIITAYNPLGQIQVAQKNLYAHLSLQRALKRRQCLLIESTNIDPVGTWPDEEGFCVLGTSLETIRMLGLQFRQNAIVWIENDAVPRLYLLR
ncbi:Protein of unknown function [Nitrosomonas sp. Nm51]|uniref:DUF3293 domain-containing protein n=1 Tax=Nitrosomonas sp. Nm51 TaxID=133720 RepID=UPI0008D194A4|nr:DUF3293 domain-containing protein [Nitrosomonas sp. Nm51]SER04147.1 Protein of unknown function [Nitrosomonas sp. Nm51]